MSDRFGNIPIQPPESSAPEQETTKKAHRPPADTTSKGKKNFRITLWGWVATMAVISVCYSALGFWGVPYYISKILPEQFNKKTGMVLEPTSVTFNPFTFRFKTGALRILSESGPPLMSLGSLVADVAPVAILRMNMVCSTVTISELDLAIARELDGSYNFQQIFEGSKNSNPSEILNIINIPFLFSLNNISITDSTIKFKDGPVGKTHTVEKIKLDLPTFSNIPFQTDQYLRPHFSAIVNGSPIELTGQVQIGASDGKDQATKLSLDLHNLDLTNYSDYLPFGLPLEFNQGTANGTIAFLFDPQNKHGDKFSIDFQLQLSKAELIKKNESIKITVPSARFKGQVQPVSRTLHLTEIAVKEPTVSSFGKSFMENIKNTDNYEKQATINDNIATTPYSLIIDLLLVDKGKIRFFQEKKDKEPTSAWAAIQSSVKNYRFSAGNIKNKNGGSFSLSGEKVGSSSYFSWQGVLSSTDSMTGNLTLSEIDSNDLLKATGSDHPFKLTGVADLKGLLTLYSKKDASSLGYKLVDAEISIENFTLMDKGNSILTAPVVKLRSLSLKDETINFGNVQFQKGTAQFTYGKLPQFITSLSSNRYRLQGLDFEGRVTFSNTQKKPIEQFAFTNISLKANELDSTRPSPTNLSISAETGKGAIFRAQGNIALKPFSMAINTGFRELPAKNIFKFFSSSLLLDDIQGNLSGKGIFKLPTISFAGELQLTDVSRRNPKSADFSWKNSIFQDLNYTAEPFHLGITSTEIDQAQFSWEITKDGNGPLQYLQDFYDNYLPTTDKQAPNKPGSHSPTVEIQEISFTNSKINIHDRRLTPDWKAEVTNFKGNIKSTHSTAATSKSIFSFTGKLDNTPFVIDGKIEPYTQVNNGTFRFSLENYPLASFYKQLSSKTDLDTSNSELKLTLDSTWQNQQYVNSGNIDIINLEPATATSEMALPLALLRDPNGMLRLSFDFSRTAPVAKTSLFDELLTSFQRKMIKGSVSPLLLAAGDYTDLIGNDIVEFLPGEFMLSEKGRKMLIRYAALLMAHPHVGLVLSGGLDKQIDSLAMKEHLNVIELQRVEKENEKLFTKWQEKKTLYEKSLEEKQNMAEPKGKIVEQNIPSDVLAGFTPIQPLPVVVDEEMLLELAQKRINILYQYFTAQFELPPERLSIEPPDSLVVNSERPTNGVTISLKAINR